MVRDKFITLAVALLNTVSELFRGERCLLEPVHTYIHAYIPVYMYGADTFLTLVFDTLQIPSLKTSLLATFTKTLVN